MKNYGLQVKEIPIIFRGVIDGITKEEVEKQTILNDGSGWTYAHGAHMREAHKDYVLDFDVNNIELINFVNTRQSITYDGLTQKNNPVWGVYYGATLSDNGIQIIDTTECPFAVAFSVIAERTIRVSVLIRDSDRYNRQFQVDAKFLGGAESVKNTFAADLTGNGQINHFRARFACGENGTLHLRPYVILNGNIRVDLCNFAAGGDQYIAGDNEEVEFDCYVPVETHAVAYVEAENVGEYPSIVDAAMTVQYEDFVESESIVGYEGVNLRRRR